MQFIITEKPVKDKLKKLEQIYTEKYGERQYAFFGQLMVKSLFDDDTILGFCSFNKEEYETIKNMIENRANKAFDEMQIL